jgi:mycothiol synthase
VTERVRLAVRRRLDDATLAAVEALLEAATEVDGVAPASEQALLRLRDASGIRHLMVELDDEVVGYAQLDPVSGSAELTVRPDRRRRGAGRALMTGLVEIMAGQRGDMGLKVWAHGDLPAAAALAASTGFARARSLWLMSRPLAESLPAPRVPDSVVVGTFTPGVDDEEWVALNGRVFTDHPEQGRLTVADLRQRIAEPWFDPAGFFVARRAGRMVGYHWTKIHDASTGEVYVVGVDAAERGSGLGEALTLIGLEHLRSQGVPNGILYVDEDNVAAVRLYDKLGFSKAAVDVMYARELP